MIWDMSLIFNFNYHGQGYAYEGCKAYLDYAFSELDAVKIASGTVVANLPSGRLLSNLGMKITSDHTGSFCRDENGNLIEFKGYSLELTRQSWLAAKVIQ